MVRRFQVLVKSTAKSIPKVPVSRSHTIIPSCQHRFCYSSVVYESTSHQNNVDQCLRFRDSSLADNLPIDNNVLPSIWARECSIHSISSPIHARDFTFFFTFTTSTHRECPHQCSNNIHSPFQEATKESSRPKHEWNQPRTCVPTSRRRYPFADMRFDND